MRLAAGAFGKLLFGGTGDGTEAFGRQPINDHKADTTVRTVTFPINRSGRVLDIDVLDITGESEINLDEAPRPRQSI